MLFLHDHSIVMNKDATNNDRLGLVAVGLEYIRKYWISKAAFLQDLCKNLGNIWNNFFFSEQLSIRFGKY
jgi:hypothetical protein